MSVEQREKIQNYIQGQLKAPISGKYLDNFNPATGEVYSYIPDSEEQDVVEAVQSAKRAFHTWSKTPVETRSDFLLKIAKRIEDNAEELARIESIDNGKPISQARKVDIPRASKNFRFFASAIFHFASECHETDTKALNYTLRHPLGVVGCISPWNLPLYLFTWKIVPALATGNCVVAKPSEMAPMTTFLLSKICMEVGLPEGVLNIVHGLGNKVGSTITKAPEISAISFTGGTQTGKEIALQAAPQFKKLSLEMGGKNPALIFSDCDYEEALQETIRSSFANQGQICLSTSRIFVEKSLYAKFRKDFVDGVKKLTCGDPLEESTQQGALISRSHMDRVLSYIRLAKEEGGTILCGGSQAKMEGRLKNGWFVNPTVIEGLPMESRANQEEIFGPVVTITPFDHENQALTWANQTPYGLATTVWTRDLCRAHRMAREICAGIIWMNCWMQRDLRTPFGGMKSSGVGREGGMEIFRFFTEPKNVCIKMEVL